MNYRSEGGSAFRNNSIELMINRKSASDHDDLGNEEPNAEYDEGDYTPIRVNAKYSVQFT